MTPAQEAELWFKAMGQQLKDIRRMRNLDREEIETITGLSSIIVARVERGGTPTLSHYIAYCKAMELDFFNLLSAARHGVQAKIELVESN